MPIVKYCLLLNPAVSIKLKTNIVQSIDIYGARDIARNNKTPAIILDKLEELYRDVNRDVIICLVQNPNTPIYILEKYVRDNDKKNRQTLAINPNIPFNLLKKLAVDKNKSVRENIAKNPQTPVFILEKLANDSNSEVRQSIAENIKTPINTLRQLTNDSELKVCRAVADHPNCTEDILKNIFLNSGKFKIPSLIHIALFLTDYAKVEDLAANYNSTSWLERYAIAQNKKTPKETLEILAKDCNRIVRATAKESLGNL